MAEPELEKYKAHILHQLNQVSSLLEKYARGDFSETIPIPKEKNEFTALIEKLNNTVVNTKEIIKEKEHTISISKQIQKSLHESEEKYRRLVESSSFGVVIHRNKKIVFVNPAVIRMLGYTSEDEILGKDILDFVHTDFHDEVIMRSKMIFKTKQTVPLSEEKFLCKDGTTIDVMVTGNLIIFEGKPAVQVMFNNITKYKQIEKTLRESEEKYRLIAEHSADVIYKLDIKSEKYTYVSPSVEKIFGYTQKEALLLGPKDVLTPESYNMQIKAMQHALARGRKTPEKLELEAIHKDGYCFSVEVHVTFILNNQGKPEEILGIARDITERKKADEALRQSEAKFKFLTENMADIIWTVDRHFRTTYVSSSIKKILGFTPEERKNHTLEQMVTPQSVNKILQLMADELQHNSITAENQDRSLTVEVEYYKKDGSTIWLENTVKWIRDEKGILIGIHGVSRDISERKQAEKALRKSEEKYRVLVENAGEVILVVQDEKFKFANQRIYELIGYKPYELKGKPVTDSFYLEDRKKITEHYRKILQNKEVPSLNPMRVIDKKGKRKWVQINAVQIEWEGKPAILNLITDITKPIRTTNQLKQNLKEKEVLLHEVHHRVKNNLSVISSLLNLQSSRLRSKKQAIAAFEESKNRINAITMVHEQLYQSGNFREIDMKHYIQTLQRKLLIIYSPSAKITYHTKIDDINIDINRAIPCGIIINELITNTLKHAFPGRPQGKLIISLHELKSKNFELMVKDNGVGLPHDIDPNNIESLGFKLITILTKQLDGKLTIKTKKGTECKIVFPISKDGKYKMPF